MFPAYQSGREFEDDLIEQLNVLPELVAAFGFANAKAPGFEADDFLAAVAVEERGCGSALVASGDRDSFQLASSHTTIFYPARGGEIARIGHEEVRQRYGVDPNQARTSSHSAVTFLTNCPALPESDPNAPPVWCDGTGRLMGGLEAGLFPIQAETLRLYRLIATMDAKAPLPALTGQGADMGRSAATCAQLGARFDEKV
jgi:DNA polymerase-1